MVARKRPKTAVVIGLGSMGRRRLRGLKELGLRVLCGFDVRKDRLEHAARLFKIPVSASLPVQEMKRADVWIISTPPDMHTRYIRKAVTAKKPCLVEASVVLSDLPALARAAKRAKTLVFPSCSMRYFEGPRKIRALVKSGTLGKPLSFVYQSGQHLSDWHPWERVKDYYVSRAATGGCREIVPFELAWLTWVFGRLTGVKAQKAQKERFGRGVEDIYQILLKFESGVLGLMQVDVLARPEIRRFSMDTDRGRLVWDQYRRGGPSLSVDFEGRKTRELPLDEKSRTRVGINSDKPYILELRDFLRAVEARCARAAYSLDEDIAVLKALGRIRRQSDERAL